MKGVIGEKEKPFFNAVRLIYPDNIGAVFAKTDPQASSAACLWQNPFRILPIRKGKCISSFLGHK